MKLVFFLASILFAFTSCNSGGGEISSNSEDQNYSKEKMDTFFTRLPGKELKKQNVISYKDISGQGPESKLDQLATDIITGCNVSPTKITDLNDGSGFEYYKFTSERSADAKLLGFTGSLSTNEILIIRDYVRYALVDCGTEKKRYGIGLRCFLQVKKLKGSVSATLPNIAASVQLNRGTAIYSLKSLGFAVGGDVLADGLSGQSDYNVDNFAKIEMTFNNVLKSLSDSSKIKFSPVELPNQQ